MSLKPLLLVPVLGFVCLLSACAGPIPKADPSEAWIGLQEEAPQVSTTPWWSRAWAPRCARLLRTATARKLPRPRTSIACLARRDAPSPCAVLQVQQV